MSGHGWITSASGTSLTSASYTDGVPEWCSIPTAVEAFPCGSLSISSTRSPPEASAAARFTAVVVFPTPPFWFETVRTRVWPGLPYRTPRRAILRRASSATCAARGVVSSVWGMALMSSS